MFRACIILALLCGTCFGEVLHAGGKAGEFSVQVDTSSGQYNVLVDGNVWLKGGQIAAHINQKWLSSKTGGLVLKGSSSSKGQTPYLGPYSSIDITWSAGNIPVITSFKAYQQHPAFVFDILFPLGANNTQSTDGVVYAFPSFSNTSSTLNYLTYTDTFAYAHVGKGSVPGGVMGGPVFLHNQALRTLAISALDNFMISVHDHPAPLGGDWAFGAQGMVKQLQEGFSGATLLYAGQGVRSTLADWGSTLLGVYGKKPATLDSDVIISTLGYWTDNGAYYYYLTEPGKNYEQTIVDVSTYLKSIDVPIQNLQLDSWWYPKGKNNGVTEWVVMPSIFPDGMKYVNDKIAVPYALHNRYFAPDTPYQHNYTMIVEDYCAVPQDEKLFLDIMGASKSWGNVLYEQDWLVTTYTRMNATQDNVYVSRKWLMDMGSAAAKLDMTIQYCMPLPIHLLQSVEIQAVTQARASNDYNPGNNQWQLGYTSMLLWGLGLVPFKDDFWTTSPQPGCNFASCVEPNVYLETLVAVLTAGPIGPSDAVGHMDRDLVMHSCRQDGVLLKADHPAMPLDAVFVETFSSPSVLQVLESSTFIDGVRVQYVMAAGLNDSFTIKASDLPHASADSTFYVVDYFALFYNQSTSWMSTVNASHPLVVPAAGYPEIGLVPFHYYIFTEKSTGCSMLGELGKFITLSKQRVKGIHTDAQGMHVQVMGAPGEQVEFVFLKEGSGQVEVARVAQKLDNTGSGTITCSP